MRNINYQTFIRISKKHGTGNFLLKSALPRVLLLRAISEKPVIAYYAFPFTVSVLYCNFFFQNLQPDKRTLKRKVDINESTNGSSSAADLSDQPDNSNQTMKRKSQN